jgi:hypothetical protein
MLCSVPFVYLLDRSLATDEPTYIVMVRTKAFTRGPFLRVLNRVWDFDSDLELNFQLHTRELQAPPERSINAKGT